jgi:hypothetical protein
MDLLKFSSNKAALLSSVFFFVTSHFLHHGFAPTTLTTIEKSEIKNQF